MEVLLVDDIGDIRQLVEVVTYQIERFKAATQFSKVCRQLSQTVSLNGKILQILQRADFITELHLTNLVVLVGSNRE